MGKPAQVGDIVEYVAGGGVYLKANLGAIGIVTDVMGSPYVRVTWISQPNHDRASAGTWMRENLKVIIEAKNVAK